MGFFDAEQLLRLCGAGTVLHLGAPDSTLAQALGQRGALVELAAPTELARAGTVLAEAQWMLEQGGLERAFARVRHAAERFLVIRVAASHAGWFDPDHGPDRAVWENAAIAAGWRRAPQQVAIDDYRDPASAVRAPRLLAFEKIPDEVLVEWPVEQLLRDRNRHMDMSRESGGRADADMVRYALAATLVRPGDAVLDCACGRGYGSAIMAAQSAGSRYIGVDIDPQSVAYASAVFAPYGIDYRAASATDLSCIESDSIDLLVSFDTIGHLQDYEAFLREAKRVLRPDGRIIASVSNSWVDETGGDPNPSRFRAFDYRTFREAMAAHFMVEERWAQTAPGGFKLRDAPRALDRLPLDAPDLDTEWLILVGSVDPLAKQTGRAYRHPAFDGAASLDACWLTDFAGHFDNPWLYRPMVQLGERVRDRSVLLDLAARVLGASPMASADFGAALTVLAYGLLEQPNQPHVDDALQLIQEYLAVDSANPHVQRWQISSGYVGGRLALVSGSRALARALFEAIAQADFLAFSPLLATKSIAASFQLGVMALAEGDAQRASGHFAHGVAACRTALHADDRNAIGDARSPLAFGFTELAEVADMGAQCATALDLLPLYRRSPGLFWQKVDVKRFGLVSWAQAVEREIEQLRHGPRH